MDLEGQLVASGSPYGLDDLPVKRAVGFIWWFMTKDADTEARDKFKMRLWVPPKVDKPIPKESPWSAENETRAFQSLKAQVGK